MSIGGICRIETHAVPTSVGSLLATRWAAERVDDVLGEPGGFLVKQLWGFLRH